MTVWEHLSEFRSRLIKAVAAVTIGSIGGFVVSNWVLGLLIKPYCSAKGEVDCKLVVLDPLEGFTTRIKVAVTVGLVFALPIVLWQIWRFVTPALYSKEKRYAVPFIVSSMLLFLGGAAASMFTLPRALEFLVGIGGPDLVPLFSPGRYLRLVLLMVLAFGVAFEFPVLLVFLQLAGVVSSKRLRNMRRNAIIGVFIVAAVITPSQDPISLMAMAVPMCLFYEAAILIGRLAKK